MSARKRKPQGNPAKLPTYGRYVVPWVTRWEGEGPPATLRISYTFTTDGQKVIMGPRCPQGWAWEPGGKRRPDARPEFRMVHVDRHRRSMFEHRCQVCSKRLAQANANWLVKRMPDETGTLDNEHPPVCDKCLPVALGQCPNLVRGQWLLGRAERSEPIGVSGIVYSSQTGRPLSEGIYYEDHPNAAQVMAKQAIVRLHGFEGALLHQ